MTSGVKCPKCGLLQLPGPICKSCRTPLGAPARRPSPTQFHTPTQTLGTTPPPPPTEGGRGATTGGVESWPDQGQVARLLFHGSGGSLLGIHVVNVLLTIITLGVYYFWAKVRVRNYLLSQTQFAGDRFAYHGTGKELLLGFLKAVLLIGIPLVLVELAVRLIARGPISQTLAGITSYAVILAFLAACRFVSADPDRRPARAQPPPLRASARQGDRAARDAGFATAARSSSSESEPK